MRLALSLATLCAALFLLPNGAEAGVFVALEKDLVDPSRGEQPAVTLSFNERYGPVVVKVESEGDGRISKNWSWKSVAVGKDYRITWEQPPGEMEYLLTVEMEGRNREVFSEEVYLYVASAEPLQVSIPPEGVNLLERSFDLVVNHPPSRVELVVVDDNRQVIGKSTFRVEKTDSESPVRVPWTQEKEGNVFRIEAKAYDDFGYWAGAEIIPWSLQIPHEDVVFPSGSHQLLAEEMPKLEAPWRAIRQAVAQKAIGVLSRATGTLEIAVAIMVTRLNRAARKVEKNRSNKTPRLALRQEQVLQRPF